MKERWSLPAAMGLIVLIVFALGILWTPMAPSTHTVSNQQPAPTSRAN